MFKYMSSRGMMEENSLPKSLKLVSAYGNIVIQFLIEFFSWLGTWVFSTVGEIMLSSLFLVPWKTVDLSCCHRSIQHRLCCTAVICNTKLSWIYSRWEEPWLVFSCLRGISSFYQCAPTSIISRTLSLPLISALSYDGNHYLGKEFIMRFWIPTEVNIFSR